MINLSILIKDLLIILIISIAFILFMQQETFISRFANTDVFNYRLLKKIIRMIRMECRIIFFTISIKIQLKLFFAYHNIRKFLFGVEHHLDDEM